MDERHEAVRVLIVDDSAVFAECIAAGLRHAGGAHVEIFDRAVTVDGLRALLERSRPDAVVIDVDLEPPVDGIRMLAGIRDIGVEAYVITAFADPVVVDRILASGAAGIFARGRAVDELVHALDDALHHRTTLDADVGYGLTSTARVPELLERLTPSERAVLDLLADGQPAKVVARQRGVSVYTVRAQIRSILMKLGVNSQLAAVALLHRSRRPDTTRYDITSQL